MAKTTWRIPSGASSPLFECDIERRTTPRLFRDVRVRYKTVFFLIMVGLLCGDAVIDHTAENYGRLLTQMYGNRPYLAVIMVVLLYVCAVIRP